MEKHKHGRRGRSEKYSSLAPKDYEKMYAQNDDIFSLLGQSKLNDDLTHSSYFDERAIVKAALLQLDFNESTTPAQLSLIEGIRVKNYAQLVELIEEVNYKGVKNVEITNNDLKILVIDVIRRMDEIKDTLKNRENAFTPLDFISLAQYRAIVQNDIKDEQLLTEQKAYDQGLQFARHAVPYKTTAIGTNLYGWESVRSFEFDNMLDIPFKDQYTNKLLLDKTEEEFKFNKIFMAHLKQRKIKVNYNYRAVIEEQPIILSGKKLVVDGRNLSQTEEAVLMMYEVNKQALMEKGLFRDKTKKRMQAFFKQKGYVSKEFNNSYKEFKYDSSRLYEYKDALNDVIATLATINYARIYLRDDTFQKVEQYLTTQASQKLAKLPRVHSSWVLPYISERVLELSKENYYKANLTDDEIKELYANSGRDVAHLTSVDEMIFAKINPSFEFKKVYGEVEDKKSAYRTYTEQEIKNMGLSKLLEKHKKAAKAEEKQKDEKTKETVKEDEKENEDEKELNKEKCPGTDNLNLAKANLKEFLKRNLTMQGGFSNTIPIRYNKGIIEKANKNKVDMEAVTDAVYKQIADNIDKAYQGNKNFYKRKDGKFYLEGWRLFMDYFQSIKDSSTPMPITLFRDILADAIELVEKHKSSETAK